MLYDPDISFEENLKKGPQFDKTTPLKRLIKKRVRLFGHELDGALGVPACPLTTSFGIEYLSKLGFDIFTYKTINSKKRKSHGKPNIGYVTQEKNGVLIVSNEPSETRGLANSIGNACLDPEWHQEDIQKARNFLCKEQLLIVSVYGTGESECEIISDFIRAAQLAEDAGAQAIECNLSCPNVCDGSLYQNISFISALGKSLSKTIFVPFIVKVGLFDPSKIQQSLIACARAGFQGICTMNSATQNVVGVNGKEFFPGRPQAGVSGISIFRRALKQLQLIKKVIDTQQLNLPILATGGITSADQFDLFFDAGADIAMSATGTMFNLRLACQYYESKYNNCERVSNSVVLPGSSR